MSQSDRACPERSRRADLYALLAELLAEPPEWMNLPGREWPLFETLTQLGAESDAARRHLDLVAGLPSEGVDQRRARYAALFASGRPRFWLYESAARTGKILGKPTFAMAQLLQAAGLETDGAELPDHVSLELAFLSHLVERDNISLYEKQFLDQHGAWMIDLGRALGQSGDAVYAPIGQLLADWLTERMQRATPNSQLATRNALLPVVPNPNDCTLCGFCAQVCPTRALKVMEDRQQTILALNPAECIRCGKCEKICEAKAIALIGNESQSTQHATYHPVAQRSGRNTILRQSPHARCKTCGKPIASQAEMDYIVSRIGEAHWQHLCLDCRAYAIR
jgi:ferredoxin